MAWLVTLWACMTWSLTPCVCKARAPHARCGECQRGCEAVQAYAMTEASHQMTSNPLPDVGPHKPGTVGTAQGSVKVRTAALWKACCMQAAAEAEAGCATT